MAIIESHSHLFSHHLFISFFCGSDCDVGQDFFSGVGPHLDSANTFNTRDLLGKVP